MNEPLPPSLAAKRKIPNKRRLLAARTCTWLVTFACFYLVYTRVEQAAFDQGLPVVAYLMNFFSAADWSLWLMVMVPYSMFFFLVDSHATWRLVRWFNAPTLKWQDMLPIRASAYILALLNEQVGKGAMSLYLLKKHRVPVWQGISSMLMLGVAEIYQLLMFSAIGVGVYYHKIVQASTVYPLTTIMLSLYTVAIVYFPLHLLYFRGDILPGFKLRDQPWLHAFRIAKLHHYLLLLLFKAPNMLGAILVYTLALALFNVEVHFGEMFAFLPVIFLAAALPLPLHTGALLLWTILFPQFPEVGVFSLLMHTFFVLFNAVIGLLFLPKVNRELFVDQTPG